ncbi:GDP-L-fucose synthase [Thiorhodovibrio winogradskyi]|uniref:GDP-L-fucose synthase n=1 Tax=Thiorhodovibrio winogradskyi TaxID=77007 RepID=A0ABZ0SGH4_9GAMM
MSSQPSSASIYIAGIKLCESYNRQYGTDFRCVMPTNLYGPGDTSTWPTATSCPP